MSRVATALVKPVLHELVVPVHDDLGPRKMVPLGQAAVMQFLMASVHLSVVAGAVNASADGGDRQSSLIMCIQSPSRLKPTTPAPLAQLALTKTEETSLRLQTEATVEVTWGHGRKV